VEEDTAGSRGQYLPVPPGPAPAAATDDNVIYGQPPRTKGAIEQEGRRAFARGARANPPGSVQPPISNLPYQPGGVAHVPVPGHAAVQERYGWYRVTMRNGNFLSTIPLGTAVLADHAVINHPPAGRQYVIVGSSRPSLGSVAVQPFSRTDAPPFCYLGYRRMDEATGWVQLFLDASQRPVAAEDVETLGVVEGLWYDLQGFLLPED
jgi:hypothetical protein